MKTHQHFFAFALFAMAFHPTLGFSQVDHSAHSNMSQTSTA